MLVSFEVERTTRFIGTRRLNLPPAIRIFQTLCTPAFHISSLSAAPGLESKFSSLSRDVDGTGGSGGPFLCANQRSLRVA